MTLLLAALGVFHAVAAAAQADPPIDSLTAERVAALARVRAPRVLVAESRVVEARGRLAGERALGQSNPTLEGVASREERFERRTQWELNVPVGIGLGWAGRSGVAKAELERDRHLVADARRGAVGAALAAYYRMLHATRGVELAEARRVVAAEFHRTAVERHREGQIPRLETLVAETEEVRAASHLLAGRQALAHARIALATALGLPVGVRLTVAGDLADRRFLEQLLDSAAPVGRADVLAAERELRAAKAARSLAMTEFLPGLAFRLNYGHEAGEPVVRPGLALSVPLFQHGQEDRPSARAREMRAAADLALARNTMAAELEELQSAYEATTRAADQLGARALPLVDESESMLRESYRAGKLDLPALLVVRGELLETRREYLDRLLDAALAGIDLAVARGHFQ